MRKVAMLIAFVTTLLATTDVLAIEALQRLQNIDLNKYALATWFVSTTSPYKGIGSREYLYPAPLTFSSAVFRDSRLFIRESNWGARYISKRGFRIGAVGNVVTDGYASGESSALTGMKSRDWTIEGGIMAGIPLGPLELDVVARHDVLDEYDGYQADAYLAWPIRRDTMFFVPQINLNYDSEEFVEHYYGVRPIEAREGRPAYRGDEAWNIGVGMDWGWRFSKKWFLMLRGGVDRLDDSITDSPIVNEDWDWKFKIAIGYDADTFVPPETRRKTQPSWTNYPTIALEIGTLFFDADSGFDVGEISPNSVDLENQLNLEDSDSTWVANAMLRFNHHNRLEIGYFELERDGRQNVVIGELPTGNIESSFETKTWRMVYGFSLLHDEQKELTILGGMHYSDIEFEAKDIATGDDVSLSTDPLLPVLGAAGSVNFTPKLSINATAEVYLFDFANYDGHMLRLFGALKHQTTEHLALGLGYTYHDVDLSTGDEDFLGEFEYTYQGPTVFLEVRF